jgi:hypothetical protein
LVLGRTDTDKRNWYKPAMSKTQSNYRITHPPAFEDGADGARDIDVQQHQHLRPSQSPRFKQMVCEMWRQYEAAKAH